jgi:hypothetical protein
MPSCRPLKKEYRSFLLTGLKRIATAAIIHARWPNMQHTVNGAQIINSSSAGARDFKWLQLINYSANT